MIILNSIQKQTAKELFEVAQMCDDQEAVLAFAMLFTSGEQQDDNFVTERSERLFIVEKFTRGFLDAVPDNSFDRRRVESFLSQIVMSRS